MPHLRLVFIDTSVARVKIEGDVDDLPLAWLRVIWPPEGHGVEVCHVYGDGPTIPERAWAAQAASIADALTWVAAHVGDLRTLRRGPAEREPVLDWSIGSVETAGESGG